MPPPDALAAFTRLRPRLSRIAYRMLGSQAEADDMVQEAWLRWAGVDHAGVADAEAYLVRLVSRLCLDQMRSARARHESYIGPWLPEPIIDPDDSLEQGQEVTLALMLALERLSPLERAAFLLHDVFGQPFEAVAAALDRDVAACRQLASRARTHIHASRPRFPVAPERGREIADAFLIASHNGDLSSLRSLLAEDVVLYADGGGKRIAVLNPVTSQDKVSRFFAGLAAKHGHTLPPVLWTGLIDGLPGYVTLATDGEVQSTAFAIDDDRITAIYITRNPDKLRHLVGLAGNA